MQSKSSGALLLVILLLTTLALAQSAAPPQSNLSAPAAAVDPGTQPAAPATVAPRAPRFVPVLFSATDTKGSPVLGLTKDQITILDSNQLAQPLQLYKGSDLPLHLGVVLLCAPRTFAQQQAAAIDLINKVIRPGVDEAFVVAARGKKPWPGERLDWKQDPAELATIIRNLDANAGIYDAFNFNLQTDETSMDESAGRFNLQTFAGSGVNVFDIVYSMMNADPRPSRRVILIFREPWSLSPGFGRRANTAVEGNLLRVIGAAQALHISAYVIGLEDPQYNGITDTNIGKNYISVHAGDDGGAGTANRNYDREMQDLRIHAYNAGRTNVERLAVETGGATYWSTRKNYSDAISAIANQLAGQYIVTFVPRDAPGDSHPLKITSSNARVIAQSVYVTGSGK